MATAKRRKPARRARSLPATPLAEHETFEQDDAATEPDKNAALSELLLTAWSALAIVRIDRIEIGSRRGWRAVFRR